MAYEMKDMTGSLWPNDRKESDRHPDRKGKVMIDGRMYWISAWEKQSSKGDYLSLSFQPMQPRREEESQGF